MNKTNVSTTRYDARFLQSVIEFRISMVSKQANSVTEDLPMRDRKRCFASCETFSNIFVSFPRIPSVRDASRFRALKARETSSAEQTWSLNYRAHGIRQTFAVNSISTPVRTRETFPRRLPALPPLFNHLPLPRDRDKPNSCKYISNERDSEPALS